MHAAPEPLLLVACLCAAWCHACQDFRAVFEAQMPLGDGRTRWLWVDIEDEEALLGAVEVDDFPTLLVADRRGPRFFGVIARRRQ